jgi:hypothetical protein
MEFVLLFTAPILQIILSVLKLNSKIKLHLFIIFFVALFTGLACSFLSMKIVLDQMRALAPDRYICGMPAMALLLGGLFITFIATPIITIVCHFIYRYLHKAAKANLIYNSTGCTLVKL